MKKTTAIILVITILFCIGSINAFADRVQNPDLAASVESVDIPNIEKHLVVEKCYDDTYPVMFGETPEKVTVNFKDGTSQDIIYDCNSEPALRNIYFSDRETAVLWIYYNLDERTGGTGKYYLAVDIGEENFAEYECTVIKASLSENLETLITNVKYHISFIKILIEIMSEKMVSIESAEDVQSIMGDVRECFRCAGYIFENIFSCVDYIIK